MVKWFDFRKKDLRQRNRGKSIMDELIAHIGKEWGRTVDPTPFGHGHINSTFLTVEEPKLVVQEINTYVFPNYKGMMENIFGVTAHLKQKGLTTVDMLKTSDGKLFAEADGRVFRAYRYIDNAVCYESVTPDILKKSGFAIGAFQNALADYPAKTLCEVIPFFHDTPKRFSDLLAAVEADTAGRAGEDVAEIAFYKAHEAFYSCVTSAMAKKKIPLAVTHNDTKVNNILFAADSGEPLALIDLDTVMPGSRLYDFGDALRTGGATAAEDEENLSLVGLDAEKYASFAEGYLQVVGLS
ncbi:MAG: aminoglycoside phosphotransferase family protein, partial [Clostridia bacterium]|nr:aminoglycoside phosphotransferase family protein [Clostridia bacterium]